MLLIIAYFILYSELVSIVFTQVMSRDMCLTPLYTYSQSLTTKG